MGTLGASMDIAVRAMLAEQSAISTTTNNIANANTPGYTRQTATLVEAPPIQYGGQMMGDGVELQGIASHRDNILQYRLEQETQQQSKYDSFLSSMQQVQNLFNETSGRGLQASISAFFNSLQALSANPSDVSLRQAVLSASGNLATAFQTSAASLQQIQRTADSSVGQTVNQINSLSSQLADLNTQISGAQNIGQNPSSLIDQRDQLITQLSGLVDVSQVDQGNGNLVLTTSGGALLVAGSQSFALSVGTDSATGFQHIYSADRDVTSQIQGGSLAGNLQVRDQTIPSILSSLDSLASNLANSVNSINQAGTDLNGQPGTAIFSAPPAGGVGYAAQMSIVLSDPAKIAAGLDGTAGDNSNVNAIQSC